ncbi:MAG: hypothetical protein H6943_01250 [Zoogloeaceae bacterium]|nr:hypothetical protein [Zoogloeaceae bacterium]
MSHLPPPSCELDQWALTELAKRLRGGESVAVMLIGIGAEDQALRMAEAGAQVLLFSDHEPLGHDRITQLPVLSFSETGAEFPLSDFDIILTQRNLARLRYDDARTMVRSLLKRLKIGGKLFISLYGIHSELGDNYPDGSKLVNERLAEIDPRMAAHYGLNEPLCLYSERNLFSLLVESGCAVLKTSTSVLGHVRGIAARI